MERAKGGDLAATRLLLERLVGTDDVRRWHDEGDVKQLEQLNELMG